MTSWIPFLYAMLSVLASLLIISIGIVIEQSKFIAGFKSMKLRDKLHRAMIQSWVVENHRSYT